MQIRAMREGQVRRIPVVDREQRWLGIVSQNDFMREAAENQTVREAITNAIAAIGKSRNGVHSSSP